MFEKWRKGYKYDNTRQYIRVPASWPIKYEQKAVSAPSDRRVTETKDISAGGVALLVQEMIPVGSRLHLEIHVPPLQRSVTVEGQIVRCLPVRGGGFDIGIRFDQIDSADREALSGAIDKFCTPGQRVRHRGSWWRRIV